MNALDPLDMACQVDGLALRALQLEADLEYKPGLVCPSSNGSHADMDWSTFQCSIQSLKGYFAECFRLGQKQSRLHCLQNAGLQAESQMFKATGGVNTHKGAIFTLGLLAGAAGWQWGRTGGIQAKELGRQVANCWGPAIFADAHKAQANPVTHGLKAFAQGIPGAREQAAGGFVHLFSVALPSLPTGPELSQNDELALLKALLVTMGSLPDTNLVHRGGLGGLLWAQSASRAVLQEINKHPEGWQTRMIGLCRQFEIRWLSPGGSADLLSAACFVHALECLPKPCGADESQSIRSMAQ